MLTNPLPINTHLSASFQSEC